MIEKKWDTMDKPQIDWSWSFRDELKSLVLLSSDKREFKLNLCEKNIGHLSFVNRQFTVDDASNFDEFHDAISCFEYTDDIKFHIILHAIACKNFQKPMMPKSWFFKEQAQLLNPSNAEIVTLTCLAGDTSRFLVIDSSESASLLLLIESTGINLNSSKRLEFCQCIKVMNNRLRLFIKEPKIMDLVG